MEGLENVSVHPYLNGELWEEIEHNSDSTPLPGKFLMRDMGVSDLVFSMWVIREETKELWKD